MNQPGKALSEFVAEATEILDAWFATPLSEDDWNRLQMERIRAIEQKYSRE